MLALILGCSAGETTSIWTPSRDGAVDAPIEPDASQVVDSPADAPAPDVDALGYLETGPDAEEPGPDAGIDATPADAPIDAADEPEPTCPYDMVRIDGPTGFCLDRVQVQRGEYEAWKGDGGVYEAGCVASWVANEQFASVTWCAADAYCRSRGRRVCDMYGEWVRACTTAHDAIDPAPSAREWGVGCSVQGGQMTCPAGWWLGSDIPQLAPCGVQRIVESGRAKIRCCAD
jgi:hypothetical protein